uniref:Uncharacterized protein n=1 Tax=Glossina pallidipes TaxID=7398 RepID=A0A1A9ZMU9_GLOPL
MCRTQKKKKKQKQKKHKKLKSTLTHVPAECAAEYLVVCALQRPSNKLNNKSSKVSNMNFVPNLLTTDYNDYEHDGHDDNNDDDNDDDDNDNDNVSNDGCGVGGQI